MGRRPAGAAWERLGATRDAFTGVRRVPDDSTLARKGAAPAALGLLAAQAPVSAGAPAGTDSRAKCQNMPRAGIFDGDGL